MSDERVRRSFLKPVENVREKTDYRPGEHRGVKRPTSYLETLIHLLKASIGSGILAMPHAFYKAGYVMAIIGTCLIGMLCTYCVKTIVSVQHELCVRHQKPSYTYHETARLSMLEGPHCAKKFEHVMAVCSNTFILFFQVGCGCIYLIFVSTNMKMLIEHFTDSDIDLFVCMVCVVICLFCAATISSLKFLAWLSFIATVSTLLSFVLLATFIFREVPTFENRTAFGKVEDYPLFIGTVVFSMEAIGAVIPLENEMKNPEDFTSRCGVVYVAMVPTVILYITIGLLGYLKYGDKIMGSISLNLPPEEFLTYVCVLLMVLGIFATNVQVIFITYKIVWKTFIGHEEDPFKYNDVIRYFCEYGIRIFLIIVTFIFSLVIPNLELLISLVGSLCLASAGIAFPALFNMFTYWHDYDKINFVIFFTWCVFLMLLGVCICIIGVYVSLHNIYHDVWT